MAGEVEETKVLELWEIAEVRLRDKELFELWKNVTTDLEEFNEGIEDIETDFLKQLRQSAPIEWKHNVNVATTLRLYNRFKKALWAMYRVIEKGEVVKIVKEKVGETEEVEGYDEQFRAIITKKPIFREKIIDNRKRLLELLTKITSDAEEQYQLLYYYCWSNELKEKAVKPHQDITTVRKKKEKEEKIKKIIELKKKGLSVRKIAKEVGLSPSTVSRILSKVENKNE